MKRSGARREGESAAHLISKRIAELGDWRGETLGRIRVLIKEADPDILEEWKWMGANANTRPKPGVVISKGCDGRAEHKPLGCPRSPRTGGFRRRTLSGDG